MVTYVLDSSAILRYLDDEAGAARVAEIIKGHLAGTCAAIIPALHWGEVAGITCKAHGRDAMELVLSRLGSFGFQYLPRTGTGRFGVADQTEKSDSLRGCVWNGTRGGRARSRFRDRGL